MSIDTKLVFCEAFNSVAKAEQASFLDVLDETKRLATIREPNVDKNALANANGAWYAWLLVIFAERIHHSLKAKSTFLKLPNVKSMPCSQLYVEQLQNLLADFQRKLLEVAGVNLVTSNPDFALVLKGSDAKIYDFQGNLTRDHLENYDSLYKKFISTCELDELISYIGVKTSLRPDRRIQLLHEGSLMKAIYTHLKTRNWEIAAKGLQYYGLTLKLGKADSDGLKSVATHSIVSASLRPERAVDGMYQITNELELKSFLERF